MEKAQTISSKDGFNMQVSCFKSKTPKRIFTSYKPMLFLFDFGSLLSAFILTVILSKPHLGEHDSFGLTVIFLTLAAIFMSHFLEFDLYSYNANFIWAKHLKNIKKAVFWCLGCLSLVVLLLFWADFYLVRFIILPVVAFISFMLLQRKSDNIKLINAAFTLSISFVSAGAIAIISKEGFSIIKSHIGFIPIFFAISSGLAVIGRYFVVSVVFNGWMRKIFRWAIVIIGSNEEAKFVADFIIRNNAPYYIKGVINPHSDFKLDSVVPKNCMGDINRLPDIAAKTEIDDIVITEENIEKDILLKVLDYCIAQRLNVWFSPKILPIFDLKLNTRDFGGLPMIRLCTQKRSELFNKVKHGLDALISLPLLVLMLPVYFIVAIAIKLNSEGPVFFKPFMIGRHAKIFQMYKFRTMFSDSNSKIHEDYVTKLIKGEIGQKGIDGQKLKITNDPRITSVGRILRKFSLDELPQLINVVKGDMSLVGPRPCTTYEFKNYEEWHKKRVTVRPGITGVWQVTGRSEVAFEDMILLDLYYIYNRSILLDFHILYETVFAVLNKKGAY
jgi:exopolysaccharide biosynthesis polyprenyl glycosylphosphotransferase